MNHAHAAPYMGNCPLLGADKLELRRYKSVYIQNDGHIGLFSDKTVMNCQS